MPIAYLDGSGFRQVIAGGAERVRRRRRYIDRINVFPVPDGDTGTNLALTLSATANAVGGLDTDDLARVADCAAEASIIDAKGNSGVMLAHWFVGLSDSVGGRRRLAPEELGPCLEAATRAVYTAVESPVEGTVLSVMRAVSEHARETAPRGGDLVRLLEALLAAGREALARTRDQLPVLQSAHVVDAGAQGFVDFLAGGIEALCGKSVPEPDTTPDDPALTLHLPEDPHTADSAERYCTELVVRGRRFDGERLRRHFDKLGSSLLLASTDAVFKLHLHTDHPNEVMRVAARLGTIEERKVDDMRRQQDERGAVQPPLIPYARQPGTVAVLCDSTADLPLELRKRHGIEMAPLQVMFGDRVYRDQIDMSSEEFYTLLQQSPAHPTTSQPPPREFVAGLERIRADRAAVIVTLSAALSGTFRSAQSGARLVTHPRVQVFDSESLSIGLGMLTLNAARLAAGGAGMDEVLLWLDRWRADSGCVIALATLEYLRRGGRIGRARSLLGSVLDVRPILTLEQGRFAPLGSPRGDEQAFELVAKETQRRLAGGTPVRLGLISFGGDAHLDRLEKRIRATCEVLESVRTVPTGVVGTHAGPGAWGVFYQRVRPDDPLV